MGLAYTDEDTLVLDVDVADSKLVGERHVDRLIR